MNFFDSDECPESTLLKILLISWITSLVINTLLLAYHLIFIIIAIIVVILFILGIALGAGQGKGGPVNVRGHYRKGSWVRSHTRRNPWRF